MKWIYNVEARIHCVKNDKPTCICCKDGYNVAYRKLQLVDHGLPVPHNLESWLNSQTDLRRHDGKVVKIIIEIEG